jgi:two-component system KDP operon response regulator KdpE
MNDQAVAPASLSASRDRPPIVLLIEDDPSTAETLFTALTRRRYDVRAATTGRHGLEIASMVEPDVVLLDLGLPDIDGVMVCRELRRWTRNPIIVLTADGAEDRKVMALDEGADDYVTKPFGMPELLARLRVALRHRDLLGAVVDDRLIEVDNLKIDVAAHLVSVSGQPVALTAKEFALLALLARNAGKVLTHRLVLQQVWDTDAGLTTLRIHVAQLRRKLAEFPGSPELVTEPAIGYRLAYTDHATTRA